MPLLGEDIVLRPIVESDAEAIFRSLSNAEIRRLTATEENYSFDQVRSYCAGLLAAADRFDYGIIKASQGEKLIGEISLNEIDWNHKQANFRICLFEPGLFGLGIGTQAALLLLHFAFEQLNLRWVVLEVLDFNKRAIGLYRNLGFCEFNFPNDEPIVDDKRYIYMTLNQQDFFDSVLGPPAECTYEKSTGPGKTQ
jgi:RimJ/RimL family protein N-acetyltransferase